MRKVTELLSIRVKKKQREAENDMESQADARIPDMDPPPAQPTPPTFPLVRDLTIPNASFPIQSKVVMWPGGGYKTRLPWVSDPNDPEINLLLDVRHNFIYLLTCFADYYLGRKSRP